MWDCALKVMVLKLWNSLPQPIWLADSVICFKQLLKTHFYRLVFY